MARSLLFTDICKSSPGREFLTSQICFLTLFRKNKILAKTSEFTVRPQTTGCQLRRNLPRKNVVNLTECLDMPLAVDWDVKQQTQQSRTDKTHINLQDCSKFHSAVKIIKSCTIQKRFLNLEHYM